MKADLGFVSVIRKGTPRPEDLDILTLSVGGNTAKAGHIVTINGETYPACDLAITTDTEAYGIILEPVYPDNISDYDLDTAITDGELVRVLKLKPGGTGRGLQVAVFLEAAAGPIALVPGDQVAIGTEAGKARKFVYTNATEATDAPTEVIGVAAQAHAGHATDDKILIIEV